MFGSNWTWQDMAVLIIIMLSIEGVFEAAFRGTRRKKVKHYHYHYECGECHREHRAEDLEEENDED